VIGVPGDKLENIQDESGPASVPEFYPDSNSRTAITPLQEESQKTEASAIDADDVEFSTDRFAALSKAMMDIISELSRSVRESENQLKTINSEIDKKKKELDTLHAIDAAAVSLQQLEEAQRVQQDQLERLISDQHYLWEEEKTRIAQEELEFLENLKVQRRREEEEYRRVREFEQLEIQRKFKQELQTVWQKTKERQDAKENELLQREQALIEKERESALLIQGLDEFISQLELYLNSEGVALKNARKSMVLPKSDSSKPLPSAYEDESSILMPANEMALSLNRNENPGESILFKQESTLLQFLFKKPVAT
jgi:DNA repair exonuclease SbcCD ATPase subunit